VVAQGCQTMTQDIRAFTGLVEAPDESPVYDVIGER
jgi:hypothetical protein